MTFLKERRLAACVGAGRVIRCGLLAVFLLACLTSSAIQAPLENDRIVLDFFYQPGCRECERVEQEILPVIAQRFEGFYQIRRFDLGIATNLARLIEWQDRLGISAGATVYMVVDGTRMMSGLEDISGRFIDVIDRAIAERAAGLHGGPDVNAEPQSPWRRSRGMTLASVIAGGIVDSFNPCAIATLVFLISVLAMSRESKSHIPAVGLTFCAGVYLTYTAMGFGLLRALHTLSAFQQIRHVVDTILLAVLAVFSVLSFRDAWRFHHTRRPESISLKIPAHLTRFIHRFIRVQLGKTARISGAFLAGVVVTAVEAVCTSQTYVPALAIVAASEPGFSREMGYLLLYNLLFVLPLLVILALSWRGMPLAHLLNWAQKNVVAGKVLMGTFFAAMTLAMLWLWR